MLDYSFKKAFGMENKEDIMATKIPGSEISGYRTFAIWLPEINLDEATKKIALIEILNKREQDETNDGLMIVFDEDIPGVIDYLSHFEGEDGIIDLGAFSRSEEGKDGGRYHSLLDLPGGLVVEYKLKKGLCYLNDYNGQPLFDQIFDVVSGLCMVECIQPASDGNMETVFSNSLSIEEQGRRIENLFFCHKVPDGGVIYSGDRKTVSGYSTSVGTNIVIDDTVSVIEKMLAHPNMEFISLPPSLKEISEFTFHNCPKLKEIVIPNSVTSIGGNAFSADVSLRKVQFSSNVDTIREFSFDRCINLESIANLDGVKRIESAAFENCASLTQIDSCSKTEHIETMAFCGCSSLKELNLPSVRSIGDAAFAECHNLYKICFTNALEHIGEEIFYGCESIGEIIIKTTSLNDAEATINLFHDHVPAELFSKLLIAISSKDNSCQQEQIIHLYPYKVIETGAELKEYWRKHFHSPFDKCPNGLIKRFTFSEAYVDEVKYRVANHSSYACKGCPYFQGDIQLHSDSRKKLVACNYKDGDKKIFEQYIEMDEDELIYFKKLSSNITTASEEL